MFLFLCCFSFLVLMELKIIKLKKNDYLLLLISFSPFFFCLFSHTDLGSSSSLPLFEADFFPFSSFSSASAFSLEGDFVGVLDDAAALDFGGVLVVADLDGDLVVDDFEEEAVDLDAAFAGVFVGDFACLVGEAVIFDRDGSSRNSIKLSTKSVF